MEHLTHKLVLMVIEKLLAVAPLTGEKDVPFVLVSH
jgi:hypothetical protein